MAVERAKSLLADEGFGVLCDIDVAKTLHEKTGADFRPYRILGACNPAFALQALSIESQLGLLLPCNLVVQRENGQTVISAIDTRSRLSIVGNPALESVAEDVNARLQRVLQRIAETVIPQGLSFTRIVTLPQDIDPQFVEATMHNGLLTLALTPVRPITPKRIAIKSA